MAVRRLTYRRDPAHAARRERSPTAPMSIPPCSLPSENLGRIESTVKGGMRHWSYAALARPMGAAPSAGTSGFTFWPVVVPEGLFARAVEGGLWLYTFGGGGWSWQAGEVH